MCLFRVCYSVFKIRNSSIYTLLPSTGLGQQGACEGSNGVIKAAAGRPWGSWPWREGPLPLSPLQRGQQSAQRRGVPSRLDKQTDFFNEETNFFVFFLFFFWEELGEQRHFRRRILWREMRRFLMLESNPFTIPPPLLDLTPVSAVKSELHSGERVRGEWGAGAGVCRPGGPGKSWERHKHTGIYNMVKAAGQPARGDGLLSKSPGRTGRHSGK